VLNTLRLLFYQISLVRPGTPADLALAHFRVQLQQRPGLVGSLIDFPGALSCHDAQPESGAVPAGGGGSGRGHGVSGEHC
jgi:hypothetical protein